MSGLMQDRDSFFNDRITHLDDIPASCIIIWFKKHLKEPIYT